MIPSEARRDTGRGGDRRDRRSTQPVKAAVSIVPSMPMLTTPDRSQTTPHRAPKPIGVAAREDDRRARREDGDQVADELEDDAEDRDAVEELVHQDGTDSLPYERVIVWASAGTTPARRDRRSPGRGRAARRGRCRITAWRTSTSSRGVRASICIWPAPARMAPKRIAAGMIAIGLERASRATAIASKPTDVAKLVCVRWVTPRSSFAPGHAGQAARHRHRQDDQAARPHAGVPRGVGVDAGCPDLEAERRPVEQPPDDDDHRRRR